MKAERVAVRCPVCEGRGNIPVTSDAFPNVTATNPRMKPCHGCGGRGWVAV